VTVRRLRWLWWLIGIVVVLGVLVVVADVAVRAYAQGRAADEIEKQLPENVQGDVDVSIGGFSMLSQLVSGSFDQVMLDAPALTVDGIPLSAHVVAEGVPTDLAKPVGDIRAAVTLDQQAVDSVVTLPGDATLTLGEGDVSYQGTLSILGLTLGYTATGDVSASGTDVVIQPTDAALTQGSNALDLGGALSGLVKDPVTVCVAEYLPQGAQIESLVVHPDEATATLTASDFVLSEDSLRTFGTCG